MVLALINGRLRPVRGGRLGAAARQQGLSKAAVRRRDQASAQQKALEKFPLLVAKLNRIAEGLRRNLSEGRFQYLKSLRDIYVLVMGWESSGILDRRIRTVAAIYALTIRAKANPFSLMIRAVSQKDRRTVSRWSLQLNRAMSAHVKSKDLIHFLRKRI
jgi:hypothetical protein